MTMKQIHVVSRLKKSKPIIYWLSAVTTITATPTTTATPVSNTYRMWIIQQQIRTQEQQQLQHQQ